MRGVIRYTVLFAAVAFWTGRAAVADEIRFKNGDRLTGTITEAQGGKLKVKTAVAGDVTVDLKDVETFSTDAPIDVRLGDGTVVNDRVVPGAEPGTVTTAGGRRIPLSDVKLISPKLGKWSGAVTAGGLIARGNSHTTSLNVGAEAARRGADDRLSLAGGYVFSRQRDPGTGDDSTSADAWFASVKYDRFLSEQVYGYATARADHDRIADLNLRLSPGVGAGYQWVERPDVNLSTEAGLSWVHENYDPGETDNHPAARLAYHVDRKFNEQVFAFHNLEYLPNLEELDDYNVNADAGIRASLTKTMFAEFKFEWRFDRTPAPDASKNDLRYLLSLGWSF